jgi:chromosomal replication initiation ATPase DnaA
VLLQVAQAYGQSVDDLVKPTRRPSEARQVGIYAARRVAGGDLKTVALRFGMGYTAVSRRVGAVVSRLRRDPRFRNQVEKILKSKVKT